jgi:hypothetical protein
LALACARGRHFGNAFAPAAARLLTFAHSTQARSRNLSACPAVREALFAPCVRHRQKVSRLALIVWTKGDSDVAD